MNVEQATASPVRLESPSGLCIEVNSNGSLHRLDYCDILLSLFPGNEMEGGPANLYLRRLGHTPEATPLLGPRAPPAWLTTGSAWRSPANGRASGSRCR